MDDSEHVALLRQDIKASQDADLILSSETYKTAFEKLEGDFISAFSRCDVKDDEGRYRWQVALNVLRAVKGHLEGCIQDGELAQERLNALEQIDKVQPLRRRGVFNR